MNKLNELLIIGNSYAAAIKAAVSEEQSPVAFAAGSGNVLDELEYEPNQDTLSLGKGARKSEVQTRLWRLSSGCDGPVYLGNFSTFVVIGLFGPPNPWSLLNCRLVPGSYPKDIHEAPPVSFSLYRHINPYRRHVKLAVKFLHMLRHGDDSRKVIFIPSPHLMDGADSYDAVYALPNWWTCLSGAEKTLLQNNENALYKRLFDEAGCDVLLPPEVVVIEGNRCPARFSENALGSSNFDPNTAPAWGDPTKNLNMYLAHKNRNYGLIIWAQIKCSLES